jgi:hypothetical protein
MPTLAYQRSLRPGERLLESLRWSAAEARWRPPPAYPMGAPFEPGPKGKAMPGGPILGWVDTVAIAEG